MAIYEYRGLSLSGKGIRGIIDAASTHTARERLRSRGIYIQELSEVTRSKRYLSLTFPGMRKRSAVTLITRQLSFLLGASLPVVSALDGVIDQLEDGEVKKMMIDIKEKIKEGKSISEAFSDYPDFFNRMYVSTLHAGEVSGKLDTVFERLSTMHEKNQALLSKVRASLTYPLVMLFFALVVVIFLISFIIPTFSRIFEEFGQVLPLPTRILMGISRMFSSGWWAFLLAAGIFSLIFNRIYRSEQGKRYFDSLVLNLPIVKKVILDSFKIRFSYTMGLMLSNGVGIIEALENTIPVFKNIIFKDLLQHATSMVRKGERLSRALAHGTIFNSPILGMIHAGEAGDRVPEVLNRIGNNTEIELEEKISMLTSLLEPVIILIIGIFVGFVVLSIMLPIYQINQIFQ